MSSPRLSFERARQRMRVPFVARPAGGIAPSDVPPALDGGEFECLDTDVGALWMPAQDEVMRPFIRRMRTWEAAEAELLRSLIRPGCRFLDVGANVGYFSLFAAQCAPGVIIDSVEPHPLTAKVLRFNLWANGVTARVWPLALDVSRRGLALDTAATNLGDTRTSAVMADDEVLHRMVVPSAPGDDLFPTETFDVVKVDVQGFELEVLTGLTATIRRSPGISIVCEFWPSALRDRGLEPRGVLEHYREMGLDIVTQVDRRLDRIADDEIVQLCDVAGPTGQVNLLLTSR